MKTVSLDDSLKEFKSYHYILHEKLGAGGFGKVYKATQRSTGKLVAIKFLSLNADQSIAKSKRYIQRFRRESELVSQLHHPGIVNLVDKGQQGDSLVYAVYDFIDGLTLSEKLAREGAMSPVCAAEIMAEVLDALVHAHEKGIVHRDIKPSNIMLLKSGAKTRVKVLDFGIGTLIKEVRQLDYHSLTLTSETIGTPSYSAPEQLRGEPPIAQTDMYMWGLVFLECLTGVPAINGSSIAAIMHQQLNTSNIPLGILAGHESASLMRRVLNKNAAARPTQTRALYNSFCKINFHNLSRSSLRQQDIKGNLVSTSTKETLLTDELPAAVPTTRLTEKKQVSVLCLILSMEYINSENSRDQEVIDTLYLDQMQQCIDIAIRYGAYHVGNIADSVMFYFGHPFATENDARLASRTALDITRNLHQKNRAFQTEFGILLAARMGLHTGEMLSFAQNVPEGKTAHIGMHLARQAESGQILCSESVRHLLGSHLNFDATAAQGQEHSNFQLVGEKVSESIGFLRGGKQHITHVGRDNLVTQLLADINADKSPAGVFCHITGEAGIGKSRLLFEVKEQITGKLHLVAQCLPEYQVNALQPVLSLVRSKLALNNLDDRAASARLEAQLAKSPVRPGDKQIGLLILTSWLGLPTPDVQSDQVLSAAEQKAYLFETIAWLLCSATDTLIGEAVERPLILCFEDIHWSDQMSIEFFQYLASSQYFCNNQHVLITTSRVALPKTITARVSVVQVKKLDKQSCRSLMTALFEGQPISEHLFDTLYSRSDGIPLFIEELVNNLISQQLVTKVNGAIHFTSQDAVNQVPLTLRDSLQQRIDMLRNSKDTLQLASAIGREFQYNLLINASEKPESLIQRDLEELLEASLIFVKREVSSDSYIFKHALVKDASYASITMSGQIQRHAAIAGAMEELLKSGENYELALCAAHFQKAKNYTKSTKYWQKSGENASRSSNYPDAIRHFQQALLDVAQLPLNKKSMQSEVNIRQSLATAFFSTKGYASNEVAENQQRLRELLEQLENDEKIFHILWTNAIMALVKAQYCDTEVVIDELLELADRDSTQEKMPPTYLLKIGLEWQLGNYGSAKFYADKLMQIFDFNKFKHQVEDYGYNPIVAAMSVYANVLWALGEKQQGEYYCEKALEYSRRLNNPFCKTHTFVRACNFYSFARNYEKVLAISEEVIPIARQSEQYVWLAFAGMLNIWARSFLEQCDAPDKACADSLEYYAMLTQTGTVAHCSWFLTLVAEIHCNHGKNQKALELTEVAIELALKHNDALYLVETYWLKINLLHQQPKTPAKQIHFLLEQLQNIVREQHSFGYTQRFQAQLHYLQDKYSTAPTSETLYH